MSVAKISGIVGLVTTTVAAIYVSGNFWFGHFAQAQDSEQRSLQNEAVVKELQEIKMKEYSAKQAKIKLLRQLCSSGMLKDESSCDALILEAEEAE